MTAQNTELAKDFQRRYLMATAVISVVTVGFTTAYLSALLRLSEAQWWHFGYLVIGMFPVLFIAIQAVNRRIAAPILDYFAAENQGGASHDVSVKAFARASSFPLRLFWSGLTFWTLGGLVVAVGMWMGFRDIPTYVPLIICLASISGGIIASIFHYFMNKSACRDVVAHLAARLGDSADRRQLTTRVTLRQKLVVSVTGFTIVVAVFAMFLSIVRSSTPLERNLVAVQIAYLEEVRDELAFSLDPAAVDLPRLSERARRLRIAENVLMLDARSGDVVAGPPEYLSAAEIDLIRGAEWGTSNDLASPTVLAWLSVPSLDVKLVAASPWAAVRGESAGLIALFLGVVMASALIAYALARFLAGDLGKRAVELEEAVLRLASGDLRTKLVLEAEDELGDLAAAFEEMAVALRTAVGGVAEGADHVDTAAGEIAGIAEIVSNSADVQTAGVQEALRATERMNSEVGGITAAAQELNMLVEESSSSILEMGAAGEELSDTAGVLSSRIEEVSSSIEQMVRSVREVNNHTSSLSEAASDTASSMEEMATAMRQVDTIADEASSLSRHVVEAAEGGRDAVRQTIAGMESIRAATAQAETVIVGLGARTSEIGSILDVIDDVADETNLLALNAAIIAAQAGEHGRAFSVVADEIKELADRVLASTKEIGSLIHAVQQESDNATGAIAEGTRSVAEGVERSRQAGAALEEITSASRTSGDRIHEILRSVQEQTKAASHVVEMMDQVNSGVEAIHRATNEQDRGNEVVSRSTVAMREVSEQLRATTEEQARGGMRIRESIDGVRDAVESINAALQTQSSSCQDVVGFLEEVSAGSQANDVSSDRLDSATKVLLEQGRLLRAGVEKFVIDT